MSKKKTKKKPVDKMLAFLADGRAQDATKVAYMLRACRDDMTSHNGFAWPSKGPVSAPDWAHNGECGQGLHGWLSGEGDFKACDWVTDDNARWMVCAVWADDVVDLGGKVKVPRAWVVFCGRMNPSRLELEHLLGRERSVVADANGCIAEIAKEKLNKAVLEFTKERHYFHLKLDGMVGKGYLFSVAFIALAEAVIIMALAGGAK